MLNKIFSNKRLHILSRKVYFPLSPRPNKKKLVSLVTCYEAVYSLDARIIQ